MKGKSLRILAAVCSLIIALALAQPADAAISPPGGAFFGNVGDTALAAGVAPGIALAVVRDGRIVYEGGFGNADVAAGLPVTARTRFAIGSLSKQFTAAAIMLLVRAHEVALDDPLAKYVPSLPNAKRITLRMLLNQTSGLHTYPVPSEHPWPMYGRVPLAKIIAILATDKPDFAPGTKWEYSNANYTALAAVVEKASGVPFATFLRKRIFAPLHMNDSGFGYDAQQSGHIAVGYVGGAAEKPATTLDLDSGAGGVVSSAHDLGLWDIALLHDTLLSKTASAQMWQAGHLRDGSSTTYAMGWVPASVDGHREVWHNGLTPGVGGYCYNALFPDDGLAIVVLTNGFGASGLPENMVQKIAAAYGIGTPPVSATPTTAPGDDPAIDARARAFWNQLGSGNLDRSHMSAQFSAAITPAFEAQIQQGIVTLGTLRAFTFVGKSQAGGVTTYLYTLTFASGTTHDWAVTIDADGNIAGSRIVR